ncbi:MAG: PTS system mannose/fructose/sorbose family transporter subunit IID [Erysipelotrichaceae bacterium]|nr:PTS system mannose/fructose/sorbose family transporter subunit IID [Erysipelotrichaceae bacterium]
MKNNVKLTKKDVAKASWRWLFFHQSAHNYERMMGTGFAHSMSGALEKLYQDDPEGLKKSLKRNLSFFNTEPQLGSIIPGISLALEEAAANDENFDEDIISSTKNALMGPLAGIGDSILVGTLNPILLSIGIGLSSDGSAIGPLVFLGSWLLIVVTLKYWLFVKGYLLGLDAVKILTNRELKVKITTALTMIGLIVIGGVASSTIKAPISFQYTSGDMIISVQDIFNRILPNLMPLIVALVSYFLVDKKNWTTNKLLLGILVFAAAMVATGIM